MKKQEKLFLIDGNALVHRAYHALPPLSQKGEPTNAVYGFTSVLLKVIRELKPDYIAATFDLPEPTFRHKAFDEYKIHRPKTPDDLASQFPKVKEVLSAFSIPVLEKAGFEADDIIGTVCSQVKDRAPDVRCVIVTGDLDTLQLINENTEVCTLKKGMSETVIYNDKAVRERFGGLAPEQMSDYKGLVGDQSDNIPGVPGVGEKTATQLLTEYKTLENIYENIGIIAEKWRKKLEENKDQAFFSKMLATIKTDVPIEFDLGKARFGEYDFDKVESVFKKFGFFTLLSRLKESDGISAAQPVASPKHIDVGEMKLGKSDEVAIEFADDKVAFSGDGKEIYVSDISQSKAVLENEKQKKIGYDLKSVIKNLRREDADLKGVYFDVMIASWLLSPDEKDYALLKIVAEHLRQRVSAEELMARAPAYIFQLKTKLEQELQKEGLWKIFYEVEMPLLPALAEMEIAGVKVDEIRLKQLSLELAEEEIKMRKHIHRLAGEEFNVDSPLQLSKILFEKIGIKKPLRAKKTKTGAYSTRADELEKLWESHPIIPEILRYRELAKIKNTYVDALLGLINQKTGRIHTTYHQVGTATGRLSSSDPNLQNIPQKGELASAVRSVFIADSGYSLIAFDFSQIELRIIASLSGDEKMIEVFRSGKDIHRATAAVINHVSLDEVTPEMRNAAKALNFGIMYGMGQRAFAETAGIDVKTAKQFIDEYFRDFGKVAEFMENTKRFAEKNGFVQTLLGRKRWLADINSPNDFLRQMAERAARNMPVQGLQADIIKLAMIKISKEVVAPSGGDVKMLMQIHDELIFEAKDDRIESCVPAIKKIMESVYALKVPVAVNVKLGKNLSELRGVGFEQN